MIVGVVAKLPFTPSNQYSHFRPYCHSPKPAVNGRFAPNIWSFGFHIFSLNYAQLCGIGTHCRLIARVTIKRHQTE